MKKFCVMLCFMFLVGCSNSNRDIDRVMDFRNTLLKVGNCSFSAEIIADYGTDIYRFAMFNEADDMGNIIFSVTYPETIAGISGKIGNLGGELSFDNSALAFPLLAEGQLSPVSAPWLFLKLLRGGYIKTTCMEEDLLHVTINDSYEGDEIMMDLWLDLHNNPVHAEFLYKGIQIISMDVNSFLIQ